MNEDFTAMEQRMKGGLDLVEKEICKLKEKMESYRHGGALYTELPPSLMELKDIQRQIHNLEIFRERLLKRCPWLDPSQKVESKPPKVPLC